MIALRRLWVWGCALLGCASAGTPAGQSFDRDPGWDGRNNRAASPESRTLQQDFGYSAGRVGGKIAPAAEPAYYAKVIPARTFADRFRASGKLVVPPGAGNTLLGFFNAGTLNEWRTPNTVAFRINGRGEGFHVHVEYATAKWRAGADAYLAGKRECRLFPGGEGAYAWSLEYDPAGDGTVTATLNGEPLVVKLDPGHKADGATFNRFGILNVMKSADSEGTLWIDDLTLDGATETFDRDPGWEAHQNRRTFTTDNIRPRFNFGYSPTNYAGGRAAGEVGGLVFRGDERYPRSMAFYGDRLEPLSLDAPLRASGKVCLRRGVTDSTVLIGFFHSTGSVTVSQAQASGIPENFLGAAIEGPSREGFLFYPAYGVDREAQGASASSGAPHIYPDGKPHDWTLEYSPAGRGKVTVTLDGRPASLELAPDHRAIGARFDRFGFVTAHIDGNGQEVYLDDLTYTVRDENLLRGHEGSVLSLAFSGDLLASASRDDTVRLWDVRSRKLLRKIAAHEGDVYVVRVSPDGRWLATGGADKLIRLWELPSLAAGKTLRGHGDVVRSVSFSPDGTTLASSGVDKTVRLWDLATGAERRQLLGHAGQVRGLAYSPDGKTIASGATDATVRLWDAGSGSEKALLKGHSSSVEVVAWSPDGGTVASGSADASIHLWDVAAGKPRSVLTGHGGEIDSLAFSPDGERLVTGSKDTTIKVWEAKTGKLLRTATGHANRVESLAFSRDGKLLASGSGGPEAAVRLWDAEKLR